MIKLKEIEEFLNDYLRQDQFTEVALNGIQIGDKNQSIERIALAVDSNLNTLNKAASLKSDLLIAHHGLFWGKFFQWTDSYYEKLKILVQNPMSLMAYHLPLDAHSEIGNNISLARLFQLQNINSCFSHRNQLIGVKGVCFEKTKIQQTLRQYFPESLAKYHAIENDLGDNSLKIGILSGKLSLSMIEEALKNKIDLIITGEIDLPIFNASLDDHLPIIPLGHYFSEQYGIKNLKSILEKKWPKLNCYFVDDIKPV